MFAHSKLDDFKTALVSMSMFPWHQGTDEQQQLNKQHQQQSAIGQTVITHMG